MPAPLGRAPRGLLPRVTLWRASALVRTRLAAARGAVHDRLRAFRRQVLELIRLQDDVATQVITTYLTGGSFWNAAMIRAFAIPNTWSTALTPRLITGTTLVTLVLDVECRQRGLAN